MIKCSDCSMLVHLDCDRMFSDEGLRKRFTTGQEAIEDKSQQTAKGEKLEYRCPSCRMTARRVLLQQVVDILIAEDRQKHFLTPFWEQMPQYLEIIKKPICFSMVRSEISKSKKYLLQPETFKSDIERIFVNARQFNPQNSEIHKAAMRLNDKANQILGNRRLSEMLEHNRKATYDEQKFSLYMYRLVKALRKGQGNKEKKPTDFKLKPGELLQTIDQVDCSQLGIKAVGSKIGGLEL